MDSSALARATDAVLFIQSLKGLTHIVPVGDRVQSDRGAPAFGDIARSVRQDREHRIAYRRVFRSVGQRFPGAPANLGVRIGLCQSE